MNFGSSDVLSGDNAMFLLYFQCLVIPFFYLLLRFFCLLNLSRQINVLPRLFLIILKLDLQAVYSCYWFLVFSFYNHTNRRR
jgi:hypothetical protein